ncbi:MAG: Rieske (2Fe-2S) protein [Cyclobacteriaceae bacterium]
MRTIDRKKFIKTCSVGCIGLVTGASLLESCAGVKYVSAPIRGSFLEIPLSEFPSKQKGTSDHRNYIIVQNEKLEYPISVFRNTDDSYKALYMRCTHQGTELQVFGDRLQCPAHGSEFTKDGNVQNGPADENLRSFPVTTSGQSLKIDLS